LSSAREVVKIEAEESPLLEAVVKELLMKSQHTGKRLSGVVMICKVWRSAIAL
jgi:hypothetical protein